ncbi:MAG: PQQ-binding-like beta-propeller repeat protein, partial [Planctomycetota bacterium]|nr:PQQ-binding-like beta-propeller repeat protein [Planctomycetota bacterium]
NDKDNNVDKPSKNILWKTALPDYGRGSPVIWGDAVFLTSHVDDKDLVLLKIDKRDGRIEWTRKVGSGSCGRMALRLKRGDERRRMMFHTSQNLASPSPVTDGEVVVAHFGNGELAAYDFEGSRLWARNLQKDYGNFTTWWGRANSPALVGDLVISIVLQDECRDLPGQRSPSYIVAHHKRTGKVVWRTMRPSKAEGEFADSYTTPILWHNKGQAELIVSGGEILDAYDPLTGRRKWYLPEFLGNRPVSGPVTVGDTIIATRGKRGPMLAFRPRGQGERPQDEIVWQYERGTPDTPWPVVCKGLLFVATDRGIAKCFDVETGELKWEKRLGGGPYRASPLAADGRIYYLGSKGLATVVEAADKFKLLAKNNFDDETFASPIVSDGKFYVRGRKWLYCLGE